VDSTIINRRTTTSGMQTNQHEQPCNEVEDVDSQSSTDLATTASTAMQLRCDDFDATSNRRFVILMWQRWRGGGISTEESDDVCWWMCLLREGWNLKVVISTFYVHVWDHVFFGGGECRDILFHDAWNVRNVQKELLQLSWDTNGHAMDTIKD
jgi:hypothetical protein